MTSRGRGTRPLKLGDLVYTESEVTSGPPRYREVLLELPPLWGPPRPTSEPCLNEPSHRGEKRLNAREGLSHQPGHTGQRDRYRGMRWENMLVSIATRPRLHELGTWMCRGGVQRPSAHRQADFPADVRWLRGTHLGEDQHSVSFIPQLFEHLLQQHELPRRLDQGAAVIGAIGQYRGLLWAQHNRALMSSPSGLAPERLS